MSLEGSEQTPADGAYSSVTGTNSEGTAFTIRSPPPNGQSTPDIEPTTRKGQFIFLGDDDLESDSEPTSATSLGDTAKEDTQGEDRSVTNSASQITSALGNHQHATGGSNGAKLDGSNTQDPVLIAMGENVDNCPEVSENPAQDVTPEAEVTTGAIIAEPEEQASEMVTNEDKSSGVADASDHDQPVTSEEGLFFKDQEEPDQRAATPIKREPDESDHDDIDILAADDPARHSASPNGRNKKITSPFPTNPPTNVDSDSDTNAISDSDSESGLEGMNTGQDKDEVTNKDESVSDNVHVYNGENQQAIEDQGDPAGAVEDSRDVEMELKNTNEGSMDIDDEPIIAIIDDEPIIVDDEPTIVDDHDAENDKPNAETGHDGHKPDSKATEAGPEKRKRNRTWKSGRTARECVALLHEQEDEDERVKGAKRRKKNFNPNQGAGAIRAQMISSLHDMEIHASNDTMPSMASLGEKPKATTHKEQMALIKQSIPEGCDLRRTQTQSKDLEVAKSIFGLNRIQAFTTTQGTPGWRLKPMVNALDCHQLTATSWMVQRELARHAPYGGILADVMGMGKTVTSLACIIGNPPDEAISKTHCPATLVVVPNRTTADQWEKELRRHCGPDRFATVYGKKKLALSDYRNVDLVIATYHEIMSQFPPLERIQDLKGDSGEDLRSFSEQFNLHLGDLFMVNWYRVMLDEAHAIKNYASRTARACQFLLAKYRWALSGTPLHNTREELFPYVKFLGCSFTASREEFRAQYTKGDEGKENFDALTSMIMYRRTYQDTWMGRPILQLPSSNIKDIWVKLSTEETIFFEILEAVFSRNRVGKSDKNQGVSAKSSKKQKANNEPISTGERAMGHDAENNTNAEEDAESKSAYARATRLRQVVSHSFNLEKMMRENMRYDDVATLRSRLEKQGGKVPILSQLTKAAEDKTLAQTYSSGIRKLRGLINKKGPVFGGRFDMDVLLNMVLNEHLIKGKSCGLCKKEPPVEPMKALRCDHVYCGRCLVLEVSETHQKLRKAKCKVDGCKEELRVGDEIKTLDCIQYDAKKQVGGLKEPIADYNKIQLPRHLSTNGLYFATTRVTGDTTLPPSTKLTAAMAVILSWRKESPDDKIIVFTQFVMTGKILGHLLQLAKLNFLYLFGDMKNDQKRAALAKFKDSKKVQVLVSSLKCGGQSLNLTEANRVILIDAWWNNTVEQQAYGRVLRRGQEKGCHLVRILTKDTFDTDLCAIQESKAEDIESALQDEPGKRG